MTSKGTHLHYFSKKIAEKQYLITDDVSMLGQNMMAWVDKRLRQATAHLDLAFGGISMILIGDFAQLPPVGDRPLYAPEGASSHGYTMYQLFTKVVILQQIVRQAGTDPDTIKFRELLMRLRDGLSTEADWKTLLEHTPTNATNATQFENAIHLFYKKDSVAQLNIEALAKLSNPIARINAVHSSRSASLANSDQAGGLQPVIFLAKSAKVMLTSNLWQQVGLCNGATGVVEGILYANNQKPPCLPIAVLVNFTVYAGPPFLPNKPQCIQIPPTTYEWHDGLSRLSRQQVPLQLSYAITIHKSQGQTLTKAVIDIGDKERAAGCTFVAISRLKTLSGLMIQAHAI